MPKLPPQQPLLNPAQQGTYDPSPQPPAPPNAQQPSNAGPPQYPALLNPLPTTINDLQATNLLAWGMSISYDTDHGLRSSPTAGPAGTLQQYWRVHGGRTVKIISCIAVTGNNQQMSLPSPNTQTANDVLMNSKLIPFTPQNFQQGQQCRAVLLLLKYELQQYLQIGVDNFDMGASPFASTPASDNILTPADFSLLYSQASQEAGFQGGPITF